MDTTQKTPPPPPPAADPVPPPEALPTPLTPLRHRLDDLIEALALDWDDPSLSAGRLCKVYHLKPEQLAAIARLPRFRATIAHLETVRAERTTILDARIREDLRAVLLRLIRQDPSNPAIAKEVRLATKQLAALTAPPRRRGADLQSASRAQPEPSETPPPPMQSADSPSLTLRARQDPDPSPLQGDGGQDAPRSEDTEATPSLTLRARPEPTPNPTPRPNPHKPKSPRGYKTRPKSKSR
jgi:hypothetical protein